MTRPNKTRSLNARIGMLNALVAVLWLTAARQARGDEPLSSPPPIESAAGEDQFLVGTVSPRGASTSVIASGFGGYDGALRSALVGAASEVAVTSWLSLRAGFVYIPDAANEGEGGATPAATKGLRANLGARAQLLRQANAGVDGAVAVNYRQDRFGEDGGLVEGVIAVGRSNESLQFLGNAAFAMDPEGDDVEGELRAAGLYRVATPLKLGVQAIYRRDLGSTDARRPLRTNPDAALTAGPLATYRLGDLVFMVHGGLSRSERSATTEKAAFVIGALGASF
jgi:hypothetical protein